MHLPAEKGVQLSGVFPVATSTHREITGHGAPLPIGAAAAHRRHCFQYKNAEPNALPAKNILKKEQTVRQQIVEDEVEICPWLCDSGCNRAFVQPK